MAQGDVKVFDDLISYLEDGDISFGDSWAYALVSDTFASISKSASSPALGSFTECSAGGNYPSGGVNLTLANTLTGGVRTMKLDTGVHSGGVISISQNASNPTDARCAIIYSKTASTPTGAAVWVTDLTEDGTTPADLSGIDLEDTLGSGGNPGDILKLTVN